MNNYSNYVVANADGRCVFVKVADGFEDSQAVAVEMAKQAGLTMPTTVYKDVHILTCDARVFSKNQEENGSLVEILPERQVFQEHAHGDCLQFHASFRPLPPRRS